MAYRTKRPCRYGACPELTRSVSGYCPKHQAKRAAEYDKYQRSEDHKFYSLARWRQLSGLKRKRSPICEMCNEAPAQCVDHIIPRRERPDLELSWSNLQSLCNSCHSKKTANEQKGRGEWIYSQVKGNGDGVKGQSKKRCINCGRSRSER